MAAERVVSELNMRTTKLAELHCKLENWDRANAIYRKLLKEKSVCVDGVVNNLWCECFHEKRDFVSVKEVERERACVCRFVCEHRECVGAGGSICVCTCLKMCVYVLCACICGKVLCFAHDQKRD